MRFACIVRASPAPSRAYLPALHDRKGRSAIDPRPDSGEIPPNAEELAEPAPAAPAGRFRSVDRLLAPLLFFVVIYVATFMLLMWLRAPLAQWSGLIAVSAATIFSIAVWERGRWDVGFSGGPLTALRELSLGALWGGGLIAACAILVVLSTEVSHVPAAGFPWGELFAVFLPAVVHEELLFRGYPFQKMLRTNRFVAIFGFAAVFAMLHAGNEAASFIGLTNVFLGGILLGLAYERFEKLWFPIGLHLAWNLMTGPILGHEVSGYDSEATILREVGSGPVFLTGGDFGIEGSIWMTLVELVVVALLAVKRSRAPQAA